MHQATVEAWTAVTRQMTANAQTRGPRDEQTPSGLNRQVFSLHFNRLPLV